MSKTNWMSRLALIAMFLYTSSASAVLIGFSPSSSTVNVGDTFDVDVVISDLGGEIITAYDLDVTYDTSMLLATDIQFSNQLGEEFFFEVFNEFDLLTTPGVIDFKQGSFLPDSILGLIQDGVSVTIASLSFEAVAAGSSLLNFDPFSLPLPGEIDVKGLGGVVLPFDINNLDIVQQANITVVGAVVPEPGVFILMLTGLIGIGVARRQRT